MNAVQSRPAPECVARAQCRRCTNRMAVSGHDPEVVLEALDGLLRMHGWTRDASGHRVCPDHPPAEEAA